MKVLIVGEGNHELSGALRSLVVRLNLAVTDCEQDRFGSPQFHTHPGKGGRLFKRIVGWMRQARNRECAALVVVVDEDSDTQRRQQIEKAQVSTLVAIQRALGLAIRTFDAWMLADQQALSRVLGYNIQQQPDPETIKNPKGVCENLLNDSEEDMSQSAMYAAVAAVIDIDRLRARCSTGFVSFAVRVEALQELN